MNEQGWLVSVDAMAMLDHLRDGDEGCRSVGVYSSRVVTRRKLLLWATALLEADEDDIFSVRGVFPAQSAADRLLIRAVFKGSNGDCENATADRAEGAQWLREIVGNPFRPVTLRAYERVPANPIDPEPWLTSQVLSLARAAYEERERGCGRCKGSGEVYKAVNYGGEPMWLKCPDCRGAGRIDDGSLDPVRLSILADALEEAGCAGEMCGVCNATGYSWGSEGLCAVCHGTRHVHHPLLGHLRSPGPHVRGCFALDCILGLS